MKTTTSVVTATKKMTVRKEAVKEVKMEEVATQRKMATLAEVTEEIATINARRMPIATIVVRKITTIVMRVIAIARLNQNLSGRLRVIMEFGY